MIDPPQSEILKAYRKLYRERVHLDGTDTRDIDHRLSVLREWMDAPTRHQAALYERNYRKTHGG